MNPNEVIRWAQQAVNAERLPWYLLPLGAAHYRAGHLDQAIKWLEESNTIYSSRGMIADYQLQNRLLLAMAHERLGDMPKARALLQEVQQSLNRVDATRIDGAVSLHSTDWLPLQLLRREAEAMIVYDPAFPTNPFANGP